MVDGGDAGTAGAAAAAAAAAATERLPLLCELPGTLASVPASPLRSEDVNRRPHFKQSGTLRFHFVKETSKLMGGRGAL